MNIEEIKQIILSVYDSEDCALTEECSTGNEYDIFNDGICCGQSDLAYKIGILLGMELKEPEEQVYD